MHPRNFVFITLLALCHLQLRGQMLTNALPPATTVRDSEPNMRSKPETHAQLPDDPGQEILPVAQPEPAPPTGVPVRWEADRQTRVGDIWTLTAASSFTTATTFCAPTKSSTTSPPPSWRPTATSRSPADPKMWSSTPPTATCGSTCTPRASTMSTAPWACAEAGAPSSTPPPTLFCSPAGCCSKPARAATASSTAP